MFSIVTFMNKAHALKALHRVEHKGVPTGVPNTGISVPKRDMCTPQLKHLLLISVLMRSSLFGFIDIVGFLLKQENIRYNEKDMYNNTALIYAKTDEIEQLFLSKYGVLTNKNDLDITGFEAVKLNRAADHGNLERVRQFLAG